MLAAKCLVPGPAGTLAAVLACIVGACRAPHGSSPSEGGSVGAVSFEVHELDVGPVTIRAADGSTRPDDTDDTIDTGDASTELASSEQADAGRLAVEVVGGLFEAGSSDVERPAGSARDTLSLGFGVVDRHQDDADPVHDALAWELWYSHDLSPGVLRPAIELGVGYSEHDVGGFDSAKLEVYRACAGGKVTLEPGGSIALWGHTGGFYRFSWDPDFEREPYDQDGGGYYMGCGLDVRVGGGLRLGAFFEYFKGTSQDDLEERVVGLTLSID